jgi:hypothetical protein
MSEAQQPTSLQEEVNLRPEPISFAEFLEDIPPSQERDVKDLGTEPLTQFTMKLNTPELQLHCPSESCMGYDFFVGLVTT